MADGPVRPPGCRRRTGARGEALKRCRFLPMLTVLQVHGPRTFPCTCVDIVESSMDLPGPHDADKNRGSGSRPDCKFFHNRGVFPTHR